MARDVDKVFQWSQDAQRFLPQWWRRAVLPGWLAPDTELNPFPLTIPAAGTGNLQVTYKQRYSSMQGQDDGLGQPFRIDKLIFEDSTDGTAAANFTVLMEDIGAGRRMMNLPIHVRNLFGTAQTPGMLRENYYMLSNNFLQVTLSKVVGAATTTRPYLAGAQYYPGSNDILAWPEQRAYLHEMIKKMARRREYVWPYWFTTDPTPVALGPAGVATISTPIGDDSHLEVMAWTNVSTGNYSLRVTEPKTRQTLMNGVVTANNALGTALFPAFFPKPYLIPSGHRLVFEFTDLSGAPNNIFISLQGRRLYAPLLDARRVEQETRIVEDNFEDVMMLLPGQLDREGKTNAKA